MRHTLLKFALALCAYAQADIVVLKTGKTVEGDILLQNEQVVIVRDRKGARFQYPMTDVQKVSTHSSSAAGTISSEANSSTKGANSSEAISGEAPRKAMFRFELAGGLGTIDKNVGGAIATDLLVGSRQIAGRELFIGGGLGYHGAFADNSLHFLPIMAALRYTFLQGEHSPYVGASIGYGIALSKSYVGGIYSGLDLGYRYRTPRRGKSICVGLFGNIQGCRMDATSTVEGQEYIQQKAGRIIGQAGIKISFGL